jgi:NIMA-interacting peptidyl-prolyl cis-trans isomerase 1
MSSLHRLRYALVAALAVPIAGCATLATSPSWAGGGMAASEPQREAEEEARLAAEATAIAKTPKEIGAKHILVMHEKSQRKPDTVTRTREDARKRAVECLMLIRGGADFDEMVKKYSDEPGATDRAGDLGVFERSGMVKAFGDAAFNLKVGEVSEIVETPFGFHIIKRTE